MFSIFSKATQPFDFMKHNVIRKLAYKVILAKLIEVWPCFFGNSRIRLLKISWLDCEQYKKNQYKKKEHYQHYAQCSKCYDNFHII